MNRNLKLRNTLVQRFSKVTYDDLQARQKENYNFQKISALLADYGFVTIRLSDDWNGADFLALHHNGETLKVQLKGRLSFSKKYLQKDLWICFRQEDEWFFYPHDELLDQVLDTGKMKNTDSWKNKGGYSFPSLSNELIDLLKPYHLGQ